ncbi:MAG: hypothetical protein ACLGI5_19590 [Thermoleophilia bacterium]
MRICVLLGTVALALMLWAASPLASSGQSSKSGLELNLDAALPYASA